jgi:hypothetical protein
MKKSIKVSSRKTTEAIIKIFEKLYCSEKFLASHEKIAQVHKTKTKTKNFMIHK